MPFEKLTDAELLNRFSYHQPKGDQGHRYEQIRSAALGLARVIVDLTPCSPEQTRALNELDLVVMLSNAAIARNE